MRAPALFFLAVLLSLVGLFSISGCENCESGCQSDFDECVSRSPAGAARAACSEQYQSCVTACEQSQDEPR